MHLRLLFAILAVCSGHQSLLATEEELPKGINCDLRGPPKEAAHGKRGAHGYPMAFYPVAAGRKYTGCVWIWVSYSRSATWDYAAATYYESGVPKFHKATVLHWPSTASAPSSIRSVMRCNLVSSTQATEGESMGMGLACPARNRTESLLLENPNPNSPWEFW